MNVFGPVPSRRLGRSMGINNIPPKICTYSCVYCQLGRSSKMTADRKTFYRPNDLLKDAEKKIEKARGFDQHIDYLTFVPDGEPTLDASIGREIKLLRSFGVKIAIITNASLLWREDVREDIAQADWLSLKIDAVREDIWKKINRPHRSLRFSSILNGILEFSNNYRGKLVTETMLVKGVNDENKHLEELADFLIRVRPYKAYLSIPIRPPAEKWVQPPEEGVINMAYQIFNSRIDNVEYLIGYEGNDFAFTGNIEEDILSITSVHPMREDAVKKFLVRAKGDWSIIEELISQNKLIRVAHQGRNFYVRKLHKN
ncbi:MAG: radical SAM protein [Candidatus Methanofastidiosia archaeon]